MCIRRLITTKVWFDLLEINHSAGRMASLSEMMLQGARPGQKFVLYLCYFELKWVGFIVVFDKQGDHSVGVFLTS